MRYPVPLVPAIFVRRYQRFFAEVRLEDGTAEVAHCANTGSMLGINTPGARCLLLDTSKLVARTTRKLRYTLEAVRVGRIWVGAHPLRANAVGREAIMRRLIPEVGRVVAVRAEVPYGKCSRADLLVQTEAGSPWLVEIKSASMADDGVAMFPDAVTERGLRHLDELALTVKQGKRALMLFVTTRHDVTSFRAAEHIDPVYAARLAQVVTEGVLVRAVASRVTPAAMTALRPIPIEFALRPIAPTHASAAGRCPTTTR